jgi:hypothetical protein
MIKQGLLPKEAVAKSKKPIAKVSPKKKKEIQDQKEAGKDGAMDLFFASLRPSMTGKCLFCNAPTNKKDDDKFHFSLAHLLPKVLFPSVALMKENIIELCFWGEQSCHTNFDQGKISWEMVESSHEWATIKPQLKIILPLVAENERKNKLYGKLVELVG